MLPCRLTTGRVVAVTHWQPDVDNDNDDDDGSQTRTRSRTRTPDAYTGTAARYSTIHTPYYASPLEGRSMV